MRCNKIGISSISHNVVCGRLVDGTGRKGVMVQINLGNKLKLNKIFYIILENFQFAIL